MASVLGNEAIEVIIDHANVSDYETILNEILAFSTTETKVLPKIMLHGVLWNIHNFALMESEPHERPWK